MRIIFLVLLLITVGELVFYIFITNNKTIPSGTVTTPSPKLEKRDTLPTGPITTPFIYEPNIWDAMKTRGITKDHKISIQIDNFGTVNEAIQNYSDSFDRTADLYLNVRYNTGGGPSMLFVNKNNIKVYIVSKDGEKKEASISDIKQGDKIDYREIINITDDQTENYQYSYIIEVYK